MKKKSLVLLVVLVLVVVCVIGGTLAWLTAKTDAVVNTFTTSDINITLTETEAMYKMIPGFVIEKDPRATVVKGSEECYLFIKLDKSQNFDSYLTYEVAPGWTVLPETDGVYYRKVMNDDMGTAYSILKDDTVAVKSEITKDMMEAAETNKPALTITAYASQLYKNNTEEFTPAEAWTNVQAY